MNQDKRFSSAIRWTALALLFGVAFALACAGANGDPAPEPSDAAAPLDPCLDAGVNG
ncbi:MAG TPA: hypothetical protein VM580_01670 [Labilithrix sp.]|jgi:hypothetical protein|nr:hypothetical protein [Labilithrix sp.]